jgi:tRNA pseudouridine55 synthase
VVAENSRQQRPAAARREVNGVLLLDKPPGLSSTQAMAVAKRHFRALKAGHTGTLDPFATGLLPICFGEATKFSRFMLEARKTYRATLQLGATSTTGDTEGAISVTVDPLVVPEREAIGQALRSFVGAQTQTPPMTSAVKQDGVALYKLARKGIEVERPARAITVYELSLVSLDGSQLIIEASVSKGTYIRVLAEDIGRALGCGAYLTALCRTAAGEFNLGQAVSMTSLEAMTEEQRDQKLLPSDALCRLLPRQILSPTDANIFCHGGWVEVVCGPCASLPDAAECAVYAENDRFVGVGRLAVLAGRRQLSPSRLLAQPEKSGESVDFVAENLPSRL